MSEPNRTTAASAVSSTGQASVHSCITSAPPVNTTAPTVDMHLDSAAVGKISLPYDVSVQLYRHRPQCCATTVLPNVRPIVIQPYPNGAVQNDAKLGPHKTALKRSRLDDDAIHGRSVTEFWGRDEMKNADLWGGGRNKEFGPFGGRNFK